MGIVPTPYTHPTFPLVKQHFIFCEYRTNTEINYINYNILSFKLLIFENIGRWGEPFIEKRKMEIYRTLTSKKWSSQISLIT